MLLSKLMMQAARLNYSDAKPFKIKIIATQQVKVYNNRRSCANGLA